jgi:hypothetical protein
MTGSASSASCPPRASDSERSAYQRNILPTSSAAASTATAPCCSIRTSSMPAKRPTMSTSVCTYPLVSASLAFVEWIQKTIQRLVGVAGALHRRIKPGHRPIWTLRLRQGQLHTDPSLDVPFAGRALPPTKARQGREVPWATRLGVETPSRATMGRLAIQCRGAASWVEGDRAGVEKWQTRGAQNAVPARACGFKSRPRYHLP